MIPSNLLTLQAGTYLSIVIAVSGLFLGRFISSTINPGSKQSSDNHTILCGYGFF